MLGDVRRVPAVKRLIALRGVANVGKSTTIQKVHQLLLAKYPTGECKYGAKPGKDVKVVIKIKGVRIGIESQGDPPGGRLEESLKWFWRKRCKVIVCATRTRGKTVEVVERLADGYELLWLDQVKVSIRQQESSNLRMASQIVRKVDQAIGE